MLNDIFRAQNVDSTTQIYLNPYPQIELPLKPQDSFGIWRKLKEIFVCLSMHDFIDLYEL